MGCENGIHLGISFFLNIRISLLLASTEMVLISIVDGGSAFAGLISPSQRRMNLAFVLNRGPRHWVSFQLSLVPYDQLLR